MKLKFHASVIRKASASIFSLLYHTVNQFYTNFLLETSQGPPFVYILYFFTRKYLPSNRRKARILKALFLGDAERALVE